jgi:hypothetical protein
MKKIKQFFKALLPVLMVFTFLTGSAGAALLDFGPIVPEVVGSTSPNIGHGFPAWFRDTNRVPLQMCLEEVPGCLFAAADRPDPLAPARFPDNLPDELFYYSATALIGQQLLFAGVEMNFTDNGDGTYEQVGFARVRIRLDTTVAGDYTVTTPWKQYFFTVDQATIDANNGLKVVNATEDIGLGHDGDFTGVLLGNIGPYVYSQGAPFGTAPNLYLGDNTPRAVQGSTFIDPLTGQPANVFRIEGPPGFTTVSTNLFAITGKLYPDPIATPLTVDKLTYTLDNAGMQVNAFATTQAISNQKVGGASFPGRFALTNVPSSLQLTGVGIPQQTLATNNPADGKFFTVSDLFAAPGILPANVTVTNIADSPATSMVASLVDEVVINGAVYNPSAKILSISATSYDIVNNPGLSAFIAGTEVQLGTFANGQQLDVGPFPVTIDGITYNIPPLNVTVKSAKLGSATAPVSVYVPQVIPATGADLTPGVASPQKPGTAITFTAAATGGDAGPYEYRFFWRPPNTATYTEGRAFSTDPNWTWDTAALGLPAGTYSILVRTRHVGSSLGFEAIRTISYTLADPAPATDAYLIPVVASPQAIGSAITFIAAAIGGDEGPYEYRYYWRPPNTTTYTLARAYSTNPVWIWDTAALGLPAGTYSILVHVRHVGSTLSSEIKKSISFKLAAQVPATGATLTPGVASPQPVGTAVNFTAVATGGDAGPYEYRYYWRPPNTTTYTLARAYSTDPTWTWDTAALGLPAGTYTILVHTRHVGSTINAEVKESIGFRLQ